MAVPNFRTLDVDIFDPDSTVNFPLQTLAPEASLPAPTTAPAAAAAASTIRQILRSGDSAGALRAALTSAPLAGDDRAKEVHAATVVEVLMGIRQAEMGNVLERVCGSAATGSSGAGEAVELGDCLMKYLYKGMAHSTSSSSGTSTPRKSPMSPQSTGFSQIQARNLGEGSGGQQMSVLLSWHEKLVEVMGVGAIVRVMTDRRTV